MNTVFTIWDQRSRAGFNDTFIDGNRTHFYPLARSVPLNFDLNHSVGMGKSKGIIPQRPLLQSPSGSKKSMGLTIAAIRDNKLANYALAQTVHRRKLSATFDSRFPSS